MKFSFISELHHARAEYTCDIWYQRLCNVIQDLIYFPKHSQTLQIIYCVLNWPQAFGFIRILHVKFIGSIGYFLSEVFSVLSEVRI